MKQLLLLLLTLPFVAGAQDSVAVDHPAKSYKWLIGVSGSLDYGYRTLNSSSDAVGAIDYRNDIESPKLGYTVGVLAGRQISGKLRLVAGLNYSSCGYQQKEIQGLFEPSTGSTTVTGHISYKYNYLELPISLDYSILQKGRLSLHASAGIMPGLFLSAVDKAYLSYDNGPMQVTSAEVPADFSSLSLSAIAALGVEYALSPRSILCAAPTFRYGIIPIADAPLKEHLWSAGLSIGYSWRF